MMIASGFHHNDRYQNATSHNTAWTKRNSLLLVAHLRDIQHQRATLCREGVPHAIEVS